MTGFRLGLACAAWAALVVAPAAGKPTDGGRSAWAGAWGFPTSPAVEIPAPTRPAGTYRYRLRLSQAGDAVTVRISNPEAAIPLAVASVTVARAAAGDGYAVETRTVMPLAFAGHRDVRLETAGSATSDPAPLRLHPGEDLIVTLVTSAESTDVAGNNGFRSEFSPAAGGASLVSKSRPYVSLVAVRDAHAPCTIVTLGDSITEGARNKDETRRGWPDRLADRLAAQNLQHHCGVVNAGISGNRVLLAGRGVAAIDRLERDVASVPGASHLILLEGINDIVRASLPGEHSLTTGDLIAGYQRIIAFAHARGIKVIGGTLTPGWGYRLMTPALEQMRVEINTWIRSSGTFDAVVDFEAALRTSARPPALQVAFDSGDHLHPGDAGYQAMADAIPLSAFTTLPGRAAQRCYLGPNNKGGPLDGDRLSRMKCE